MRRLIVHPNRIENDFNKMFHNFFNHEQFPVCFDKNVQEKSFNPKVNVVELENSFSLTFELPGLEKAGIKVLVKDNILTVSGERKVETEMKSDRYTHTEISSGSFERSFNLPETIKQDSVQADYKNGLLHIELLKKEESKPKEIEINIS